MRLSRLAATTAALLLTSTTLSAQDDPFNFQTVFLDVDGTPVEVTAALGAAACALDETGVQQATTSRLESSGLDTSAALLLYSGTGFDGTSDPAAVDTVEGSADTASTDPASSPAPGGEPASTGDTDIAAADTPAPGGDSTSADSMTGTLEGAEITSSDNLAVPNSDVTEVQSMDSDATRNEQRLRLAVCQIDATRAADLGLSGVGDGMDASGN